MRHGGIAAVSVRPEPQPMWIFAIVSVDHDFVKKREHQEKGAPEKEKSLPAFPSWSNHTYGSYFRRHLERMVPRTNLL